MLSPLKTRQSNTVQTYQSPEPSSWRHVKCSPGGTRRVEWSSKKSGTKPGIYAIDIKISGVWCRYIGRSSAKRGVRGRVQKHFSLARTGRGKGKFYDALRKASKVRVTRLQEFERETDEGVDLDALEMQFQGAYAATGRPKFNSKKGGGGRSTWEVRQLIKAHGPESLPETSPIKQSRFNPPKASDPVGTPKKWVRLYPEDLENHQSACRRIVKQLDAKAMANVQYDFLIAKQGRDKEQRYIGVAGEFAGRLRQHLSGFAVSGQKYAKAIRHALRGKRAVYVGISEKSIPTDKMFSVERRAIERKPSGLNATKGGNGSLPAPQVKKKIKF